MNRQDAARKVAALRQVRVDRGATPNEAHVAAAKAARLTERYGLTDPPPSAHAPRARRAPPRPAPATGFHWSGPAPIDEWLRGRPPNAPWHFDVASGEHSDNVHVHSYRDRSNWRIEIDP